MGRRSWGNASRRQNGREGGLQAAAVVVASVAAMSSGSFAADGSESVCGAAEGQGGYFVVDYVEVVAELLAVAVVDFVADCAVVAQMVACENSSASLPVGRCAAGGDRPENRLRNFAVAEQLSHSSGI